MLQKYHFISYYLAMFSYETIWLLSFKPSFFSRVLRDSTPRFVGPSVGPSVRHTLLFFVVFFGLWPHCSCPNDKVTSNMAPAHPHATGVAVYPALFFKNIVPSKNDLGREPCPVFSLFSSFPSQLRISTSHQSVYKIDIRSEVRSKAAFEEEMRNEAEPRVMA